MEFAKILRDLRGEKTQEAIAESVGITKSSWAMYERGERVPRDEVKIRIADYFGVSVQDIFLPSTSTNSARRGWIHKWSRQRYGHQRGKVRR